MTVALHLHQATDEQLLEHLKTMGESALQILYERYVDALYNRAYAVLRNEEDAEEVVQDVFLKFWNCRYTLVIHTSVKAYLFQMCRNQAFDQVKAKARRVPIVQFDAAQQDPAGGLLTENEVIFNEYHENYLKAVEALPPGRKRVYHLCHTEGKTYDQVAAQLSISRNAVKDHIVHATRFIKKYVELTAGVVLVAILLTCFIL